MIASLAVSTTVDFNGTCSLISDPIVASVAKASYFGAAIETLMFGIFLVLFPQAIYVLLRYPKAVPLGSISHFNKTVLVVCSILFCSITAVSSLAFGVLII